MAFLPKQITQYQAEHLTELQGNASETIIKYSLGLIPPFVDGDNIHDNAAGSGAVTATIFEQLKSGTSIHIDATDINAQFVQGCKTLAESKKWPVDTAVMSAQQLTYSDETFTHSFTSFAFHCIGDHDTAANQVYRTLKSGGTAVVSVWTYMPHVDALQHAHWRTRGRNGPMPVLLPLEGFEEADLCKALKAGGFQDIECFTKESYVDVPDVKRWAQLAWSYLGTLPTGWSQNDEDKWDEAIADIVEQLEGGDGISKNENGDTVLKMVACIAIAKK